MFCTSSKRKKSSSYRYKNTYAHMRIPFRYCIVVVKRNNPCPISYYYYFIFFISNCSEIIFYEKRFESARVQCRPIAMAYSRFLAHLKPITANISNTNISSNTKQFAYHRFARKRTPRSRRIAPSLLPSIVGTK